MGRPAEITKNKLQSLGITEVTKDGKVFMGDVLIKSFIQSKKSRFKVQQYRTIHIYDPEIYQKQKAKYGGKCVPGKTIGMRVYVLSRVMYAWFNGVCPANMDVDHIDNNSLNDTLDNLQLLTRQENLAKRTGYRNQYLKSYRGD